MDLAAIRAYAAAARQVAEPDAAVLQPPAILLPTVSATW